MLFKIRFCWMKCFNFLVQFRWLQAPIDNHPMCLMMHHGSYSRDAPSEWNVNLFLVSVRTKFSFEWTEAYQQKKRLDTVREARNIRSGNAMGFLRKHDWRFVKQNSTGYCLFHNTYVASLSQLYWHESDQVVIYKLLNAWITDSLFFNHLSARDGS